MADVLAVGLQVGSETPSHWRVLQRVRHEIVVLEVDEDDVPVIAAQALLVLRRTSEGAVDVLGDEHVLDALDAGSRLFVRGWRSGSKEKDRLGDGLPWDAEGFQGP